MSDILSEIAQINAKYSALRNKEARDAINKYYRGKYEGVRWVNKYIDPNLNKWGNFVYILEVADEKEICPIRFTIDAYNNFSFDKTPSFFPLLHLTVLRDMIHMFYDNNKNRPYQHRLGTGFFISYWEYNQQYIDLKYTNEMIAIDNGFPKENWRGGLRQWLVGNTYTNGGNLKRFKKWDYDTIE